MVARQPGRIYDYVSETAQKDHPVQSVIDDIGNTSFVRGVRPLAKVTSDYFSDVAGSGNAGQRIGEDLSHILGDMWTNIKERPGEAIAGAIPILGEASLFPEAEKLSALADQAEARGDQQAADKLRAAGTGILTVGMLPGAKAVISKGIAHLAEAAPVRSIARDAASTASHYIPNEAAETARALDVARRATPEEATTGFGHLTGEMLQHVFDALRGGKTPTPKVEREVPVEREHHAGGSRAIGEMIRGWHGSGKQFREFNPKKMGTGVGEMYGRGAYVASDENVARQYREMGLKGGDEPKVGRTPMSQVYADIERQAQSLPPEQAQALYNRMSVIEDAWLGGDKRKIANTISQGEYDPEALKWFNKSIAPKLWTPGGLYEVGIKAKPEQFLHWQKPLSEQSPLIQEVMRPKAIEMADVANQARAEMLSRGKDFMGRPFPPERIEALKQVVQPEALSGVQLYGQTQKSFGAKAPNDWKPEATQQLRESGIVGNTYSDMTPGFAQSQNYVVYDPAKDLEILNRYASGGTVERNGEDNAPRGTKMNEYIARALHLARGGYATDGSVDDTGTTAPQSLDARIADYERQRAEIQAMPEYYRQMTHGPEAPRAPIEVEGGFIGKKHFGDAPYDVAGPLSKLYQTAYDMKTAPLYALGSVFPPAAGLGMALDTAEGVAAGSPSQVALSALGAPGKAVKYGIAPLAAATGMLSADEAQADRLPKAGRAVASIARAAKPVDEMSLERAMEIAKRAGSAKQAAPDEVSGLFDYSRLSEIPKVSQFDLPRYVPARGVPARVTDISADPAVRDQMLDIISRGREMGGANWYNTDPLRDKFVEQLGEDAGGKAHRKYMDFVAATSPRSKVGENVRNASYYYGREMRGEGMPAVGERNPQPYGHMAQRLHQMNAERVAGSGWDPLNNPKPASFVENLVGNQRPATVDTHAFRLPSILAQDPRFLETAYQASKDAPKMNIQKMVNSGEMTMEDALKTPAYWQAQPKENEYGAMERFYQSLGHDLGMTPAQTQASAWVGGSKLTGLGSDESKPFLRFFDDRVMKTAREMNMDPKDVLRDFIAGKLSFYAKGGAV